MLCFSWLWAESYSYICTVLLLTLSWKLLLYLHCVTLDFELKVTLIFALCYSWLWAESYSYICTVLLLTLSWKLLLYLHCVILDFELKVTLYLHCVTLDFELKVTLIFALCHSWHWAKHPSYIWSEHLKWHWTKGSPDIFSELYVALSFPLHFYWVTVLMLTLSWKWPSHLSYWWHWAESDLKIWVTDDTELEGTFAFELLVTLSWKRP